MASCAALISLRHSLGQIYNHPRPPISLDKTHLESIIDKCVVLLGFLESWPRMTTLNVGRFSLITEEIEALESRMADVAYAAEDLIDSHIVDQIQAASTSTHSLDKVIDDGLDKVSGHLELLIKDVTEIRERMTKIPEEDHRPLHKNDQVPPSAATAGASRGWSSSVGLDDVLIQVMDKLTGPQSSRQIIPIVGMGGIGKTTLAKNVFVNPLIVHHFDILAWATISHEFNSKQILSDILISLKIAESGELHEMNENEIGEKLYKNLWGRRYLIVMDDIWSMEAWDKLGFFFPDNNNGSRIVITTREWYLVSQLSCPGSYFGMRLLNEDESWNLLSKSVFGKEDCLVELEEIGKNIAKNCKGLPLSIVVIGGLLAKSNPKQQYWRYIAENLNEIVNLEDNERCFKTLRLSYNQLPISLKPLFLYMGIYPEDHKIYVPTLIRLWVAEGILPPPSLIRLSCYEEVARNGLMQLIRRNLISICELSSTGNIKYCSIHDLLRDICIKEAEKDKFFRIRLNIGQSWRTQRRIGIHKRTLCEDMQSASLARSLICNITDGSVVPTTPYRLLRVLNVIDKFDILGNFDDRRKDSAYLLEDIFHLVNLRHLAIVAELPKTEFPSSIYHLWNLQTLVVNSEFNSSAPLFDIWKMPKIRHVKVERLMLPDPPMDDGSIVLWNLQTLHGVYKFKCDEDVVKRIPNIKKLGIIYDHVEDLSPPSYYCLNNLCHLLKLESLSCSFGFGIEPSPSELVRNLITFPHSLKKLTLQGTRLSWEDMATKIGSLPCLEVLIIEIYSFVGPEWLTVEDQFRSLKYLCVSNCYNLEYWRTESSHFPCLEHLVVAFLRMLKELPSDFGDIPTLKSIEVRGCSDSVVISAKKIQNEQEELGNDGLRFEVFLCHETQLVTEANNSLVSHNFEVSYPSSCKY